MHSGTLTSIDITDIGWSDHFNYETLYTANPDIGGKNWSFTAACGTDFATSPINSSGIFTGLSFGYNDSCTGAASGVHTIQTTKGLPLNYTDSRILITYNYSVQRSDARDPTFMLTLTSLPFDNLERINFIHSHNTTAGHSFNVFATSSTGTPKNCNLTNLPKIPEIPFTAEFVIIIDQVLNTYSWYVNGTSEGCEGISLGSSGLTDLIGRVELRQADSPNGELEVYVDDLVIGRGSVSTSTFSTERCPFPLLFCDDFNYNTPLQNNGWIIFNAGGIVNQTFSPKDNKLVLDGDSIIRPFHPTPIFPSSYFPDSQGRFIRHFQAPAFSSEFILNFNNNTDNNLRYSAFEKIGNIGWSIRVIMDLNNASANDGNASGDMNWQYRNDSIVDGVNVIKFETICGNCTFANVNNFIKINTFFAQRDNFPFNSSIIDDRIDVYANGKLLGTIPSFITGKRFTSIREYEFSKNEDSNFTIDNYQVMVGTDSQLDTSQFYYDDFFQNISSEQQIPFDTGTGELIDAVNSIWADFGMKTQASRVFAGLFLMFFLAAILFGAYLANHTQPSALVIGFIELLFMIFLVYIKLLPLWIPFVIVLLTAGIGALIFKMASG